MPPSWHPVPACAPRPCCRRAVLSCCYDCFRRAIIRCRYECCRPNCSTLRRRKLESDAVRYCGRDRRPTTMLQVGRFTLRRRKLASDAAPLRLRLLQAELFYFAGTMALHRFLISGQDLRIDVAKRPKQGQTVHRFLISGPDLRIDVAKRPKQGNPSSPRGEALCRGRGMPDGQGLRTA